MDLAKKPSRRVVWTLPWLLWGCIETTSTTEESSSGTPIPLPDYVVTADPQNPPPSGGDNNTQPVPVPTPVLEEGLIVNGGALRTNSTQLDLELITLNRNQMKITLNRDCSGGTWEPWSPNKSVQAPAMNSALYVSVQYMDWDYYVGHCYRQMIVHDDQGPEILFPVYPSAQLEEGQTTNLVAEVRDASGPVKQVTCRMNGIEKPCFAGRNEVSITALPLGDYEFSVQAQDDLGNSSTRSVRWSVVSTTKFLRQNVRVDNYKKVDILFVIDNSGSMQYEQQSMGNRTRNFLSVLRGLDYQIAVTTTDERNVTLGDGRFIPIWGSNGQYVMDTSIAEEVAQERLSKTLQRSETGSGKEQGIRAAYRVIDRFNSNEGPARQFFREGAQFAVVLISDEDESDNTFRNDPQNLISHVASSFGGQKRFGYHSIITRPGDTACRSTHGYAYGDRYKRMSELTGGIIGSVCEADYAAQVTGIAQGVRDLLKTLSLQCEPLVDRGIVVKREGQVVANSFVVEGVNLKFSSELEPGQYTIDYHCLK